MAPKVEEIEPIELPLATITFDINFDAIVSAVITKQADIFAGESEGDVKEVLMAALEQVVVRPVGVKTRARMAERDGKKGLSRIFDRFVNRTWTAFCLGLWDKLTEAQRARLEEKSPLKAQFKKLWPDCSDEIDKAIMSIDIDKQMERERRLRGIGNLGYKKPSEEEKKSKK